MYVWGRGGLYKRVLLSFGGQLGLPVLRYMHVGYPTGPSQSTLSVMLLNNATNRNISAFFPIS